MSLAHDINAIERIDPQRAWNLENSLDFGYERLRTTGDGDYFTRVIEMIHRAAEDVRAAA